MRYKWYEPIVERLWGWTIGLLFASAFWVDCERWSGVITELFTTPPPPPHADIDVVEADVVVEDGFVAFVAGFVDQELQVSQPSAERVDSRQQDQRLPLQRPAW